MHLCLDHSYNCKSPYDLVDIYVCPDWNDAYVKFANFWIGLLLVLLEYQEVIQ